MLDKKDAQWWIDEVQKHPEHASDLVRALADRLAFLDQQNEELRGEVITLKRRTRTGVSNGDEEALRRRIQSLEAALKRGGISDSALMFYAPDRIERLIPASAWAQTAYVASPEVRFLRCEAAMQLYIITAESRVFAMDFEDLPLPQDGKAASLGNPNNVAVMVDQGSFQRARFGVLRTQNGYVYHALAGALAAAGARGEKLIRTLIPGDPIVDLLPAFNGDLFGVSVQGRWTRFPERAIAGSGSQVMSLPKNDSLLALIPLESDSVTVYLVGAEGRLWARPATSFSARKAPGVSAGQIKGVNPLLGAGTGSTLHILSRQGKIHEIGLERLREAASTEQGIGLPGLSGADLPQLVLFS